MFKNRSALFVFGGLLLLILSGCVGESTGVWTNAPDWSRALLAGTTDVIDPIPIVLDDAGNIYLFVIANENDEQQQPQVLAFDSEVNRLWQTTLDFAAYQPKNQVLLWGQGALQLYWISDNQLYHAVMSAEGILQQDPVVLSGEDFVEAFSVIMNAQDQPIVWYGGTRRINAGLYALLPGQDQPILIDENGVRPMLRYDDAGDLHALWLNYPTGYNPIRSLYAVYPDGIYQPNQQQEIFKLDGTFNATKRLEGPVLGLDKRHTYIFWTVFVSSGPQVGAQWTNFVVFPHGEPEKATEPQDLYTLGHYDVPYVETGGDFHAGKRVSFSRFSFPRTNVISDISTSDVLANELAIAVQGQVQNQFNDGTPQINTMFIQGTNVHSAQLLSLSTYVSQAPAIVAGKDNYLYVTWIERYGSGFNVYLTSTNPNIVRSLSHITTRDVLDAVIEIFFGILSGIIIAPIVVPLLAIAPGSILAIGSFLYRNQNNQTKWLILNIGVAILVYLVTKFGFFAIVETHVPFSLWIPFIPNWLKEPLKILVPGISILLGLWTAWRFTFRRQVESPMYFLGIFIVVDGLITVGIYGSAIFSAF